MPTDTQIDAPLVVASLLILGILGGSLILWIKHIQGQGKVVVEDSGVSAWSIGWVNFGIFVCAMIIAVYLTQIVVGTLFFQSPASEAAEGGSMELTPWLAVLSVLLLQLPLLAIFYGARRFYPGHYACRLNSRNLSPLAAMRQAVPRFLMYLPIIWIASLVWTNLLSLMEYLGLIQTFEPQELITLFQAGGDPLAIGLLVSMAVVLAPIVEETIFRGCIYRFLKSQTTLLPAQIISGCLFSFMHWNLLSFVPLVLVGIFLARIYEKSRNLMVSMWFHAFFNAFSLLMLLITSMSAAIPQ
jgi:membrane protease YdiL (CAAX protease family)